MREEVKLGVDDMEQKVAARLDQSLAPLKEQLCEEKEARQDGRTCADPGGQDRQQSRKRRARR